VLSGNREATAEISVKDVEVILAAALTGMTVDEFKGRGEEVAGRAICTRPVPVNSWRSAVPRRAAAGPGSSGAAAAQAQ
jgi:hypothetical protein